MGTALDPCWGSGTWPAWTIRVSNPNALGLLNSYSSNLIFNVAEAVSAVFFVIIAAFTALLFVTSKNWIFYEGEDR